jgi:polyhydroxyalkanoate synthesis regulator phasin
MTRSFRRMMLATALGLVALLTVGGASALAHGGGGGGKGRGGGPKAGAISASLVTEAAKQLGVTPAALRTAISNSAKAEIDEAVADGDVDSEDAAALKERVDGSLRYAYSLSRASKVAAGVGKTTAQLNTAFRAARKAAIVQKIDEALEDGELDADEAADLKEELEDATLPGYKQSRFSFELGYGLGFRP